MLIILIIVYYWILLVLYLPNERESSPLMMLKIEICASYKNHNKHADSVSRFLITGQVSYMVSS